MAYSSDTGNYDYDRAVSKRKLAEALLARDNAQAPRNLGEGLNSIGNSIFGALMLRDADLADKAGKEAANNEFMGLFGGGQAGQAPVSQPQAQPQTNTQPVKVAPEELKNLFAEAGNQFGISPSYLERTAQIESSFNPNAKNPNSSAGGLFQFIDATAQQYGLTNKFDPRASTLAAAQLAADNKKTLEQSLGRPVTDGELYLAHQQGAGGALKLLQNPQAQASQLVGGAAASLNGGGGLSAGDFANKWVGKFGNQVADASGATMPSGEYLASKAAQSQPVAEPKQQVAQALGGNVDMQEINNLARAVSNPYLDKGKRAVAEALLKQRMEQMSPKERYDITNINGMQVQKNSRTGELKPLPKNEELTNDIREYNLAKQQGYGGNFSDYQKEMKSAGAAQVNIDQKAEGAFKSEAGKLTAKRYDDLASEALKANEFVGDINALKEISKGINTGKGAQLTASLAPYADALGVKIDGLGEIQAYDAIVAKLAPRMRATGSGATSDFEAKQFLKALPSLGNTEQGNALITNTLDAIQQHKIKAGEIASMALSGEIPQKEADKMIRELPDPWTLWKENKDKLGGSATTTQPVQNDWKQVAPNVRIREVK